MTYNRSRAAIEEGRRIASDNNVKGYTNMDDIYPAITKEQENVTLSQTGSLCMKSVVRCWSLCFIALEHIRSYSRISLENRDLSEKKCNYP